MTSRRGSNYHSTLCSRCMITQMITNATTKLCPPYVFNYKPDEEIIIMKKKKKNPLKISAENTKEQANALHVQNNKVQNKNIFKKNYGLFRGGGHQRFLAADIFHQRLHATPLGSMVTTCRPVVKSGPNDIGGPERNTKYSPLKPPLEFIIMLSRQILIEFVKD